MTKKCKFEVEVTYNSNYFAEGEIKETIKNAIRDLNDAKEQKFGKRTMCDPGKTNKGITSNVTQTVYTDNNESTDIVETLVSLSACMDETESPNIVLPEPKIEELMSQVRKTFNQ